MEKRITSDYGRLTRRPFRTAAVLGAGVMGAQIAAHLANTGLEVLLLDIAPKEGPKNAIVENAWKMASKLNPAPLFDKDIEKRIRLGNFDEHFDQIADVEWVIEAVVERMDIKKSVMARIEAATGDHVVVSSNTSGLPIAEMAADCSEAFKRRFLGTHFFNPPRYLKLLELIPTPDTDAAILERISWFGRVHLGKGVVLAKDTPNFIGNRIGVYAMMRASKELENGYTIEEIDALTGPIIGRPSSATFRTADVVGLDTMAHVCRNLYNALEGRADESRDLFSVPRHLEEMIAAGMLGQKTKAGFYKKVGKEIHSLNLQTKQFEPAKPKDLGDLSGIRGGLPAKMKTLWADKGRAGAFFRDVMVDTMAYAARRIPEISDTPLEIDQAICWGFGWEAGPFETWDALGFETVCVEMEARGIVLPDWVAAIRQEGLPGFYQETDGRWAVYIPETGTYRAVPTYVDNLSLNVVKQRAGSLVWKNDEAALLDIGDGVALFEFRSKANALGVQVMEGLRDAIRLVEDGDWRGLVIGNEGKNFSVGANLGEMVMGMMMGDFVTIETMIAQFQNTIQQVYYSTKPVIVAAHQRVLGGGCEMTMASAVPVVSAETYMGLVELGVGLIPAGCGTMRMTAYAAERAPTDFPSDIQTVLRKHFETIAMAKVATSGRQAISFGFLPAHTRVVMHDDRRLFVAKQEVIRLSEEGYLPPPVRNAIKVVGRDGRAQFEAALYQFRQGKYISDYDRYLGSRLAYVMTGGDLSEPTEVHEDYLLELEREVFLSLLGEAKTQARIESILTTNKPLRN
ncbi:MAG: 3-hydroxyacyl-CoA dehydrogenase/enoyl-CoA hydratase family protein [Bacteroidetes Order II. Incertae sedis bacterium]|nr:3-hydroxyacyl-CoA dehydrogenase/enoyl-CoA hydratase family protein [Bacteroidetes Order II. bacterium]